MTSEQQQHPFLARFVTIIKNNKKLSEVSKTNYIKRLSHLVNVTGHDINWIVDNCVKTMSFLKDKSFETKKAYINSILTLFKYTANMKSLKSKQYNCWFKQFQKVNDITESKYDNIEASDKQIDAYIDWKDVLTTRDKLNKESESYLILCLYTMIPPSRADMNNIKILRAFPGEDDIKKQPNYLVWKDGKMTLVYNEFKSKGRSIPKYEKELPAELVEVIKNSLDKKPRDYLIVSPRTGGPYLNVNSYTKYVHDMWSRVFGKKVTFNTLRHSFVNTLDFNGLTPGERDAIARDLMHSERTMQRYKLRIPTGSKTGEEAPKKCRVVCD